MKIVNTFQKIKCQDNIYWRRDDGYWFTYKGIFGLQEVRRSTNDGLEKQYQDCCNRTGGIGTLRMKEEVTAGVDVGDKKDFDSLVVDTTTAPSSKGHNWIKKKFMEQSRKEPEYWVEEDGKKMYRILQHAPNCVHCYESVRDDKGVWGQWSTACEMADSIRQRCSECSLTGQKINVYLSDHYRDAIRYATASAGKDVWIGGNWDGNQTIRKTDLVKVMWTDSANHSIGWVDPEDFDDEHEWAVIESVGVVLKHDDKGVTLVQSTCIKGPGEQSFNNAMSIPRGCIRSITKLQVKDD